MKAIYRGITFQIEGKQDLEDFIAITKTEPEVKESNPIVSAQEDSQEISLPAFKKIKSSHYKAWADYDDNLEKASFDNIRSENMPLARDMIKGLIRVKGKMTLEDCRLYLDLSPGEAKAFMVDVFNQQVSIGYRVRLVNQSLVFQ